MNLVKINEIVARAPIHRPGTSQRKDDLLVGQPDIAVLQEGRREAPPFPIERAFGAPLAKWITAVAENANSPIDYVAGSLLAATAALIGNARAAKAFENWEQPAVLWIGLLGDPSTSKSPGMESILSPLRWLESEISCDFEVQQRQHAGKIEAAKVAHEAWQRNARELAQLGDNIPAMPTDAVIPEPLVKPRICISDATPEAVARILTGNPRGVLLTRDELSGWLASFGRYEGTGRAFWTEAYGANPFTVDRVKHEEPLRIQRLSVSVVGGIQPAKLEPLFNDADDGFAARFLWLWPEPRPFSRSRQAVDREQIRTAFWRLYSIEMAVKENGEPCPQVLPLSDEANDLLEVWCLEHDKERGSGLFQSALGKMRGQLLRLALVLEHIWWAVDPNSGESPTYIGENAVSAAADLMTNYFKPMCARVYGDAALPEIDRNTAALARWIVKERPTIINARTLRRDTPPTPQLRQPKAMEEAIQMLVDTNWLTHAPGRLGGRPGRARADYVVNPLIWERLPAQ